LAILRWVGLGGGEFIRIGVAGLRRAFAIVQDKWTKGWEGVSEIDE
jgi:hypothetical protein